MAEQKHYISQYRASNGTVFFLKDREVREALKSKANASSLGVATKRIDDLESTAETLAAEITGVNTLARVERQLAINYFLPPWKEGVAYNQGAVIRLNGRVFESLSDGNTACPYTLVTDTDGRLIVDENWHALISENVNERNWSQLSSDEIPSASIPDRMTLVEERQDTVESRYAAAVQEIEARYTKTLQTYTQALNFYREELERVRTERAEFAQKLAQLDAHTFLTA